MTLWYYLVFHSFTVYGKNEFLKSSVLTLKFGRSEKRVVYGSDDLGMRSFKYWGKPLNCILKK